MTTLNQGIKTMNQRRATEAALTNEQVTRQRVDLLEAEARKSKEHVVFLETLVRRGFSGRLRWLFLGR